MPLIGVRELRQRTTEVLRQVREEKTEYIITYQGHPVALLLPVSPEEIETAMVEAGKKALGGNWETYVRLSQTLQQNWPDDVPTQSILNDVRRE